MILAVPRACIFQKREHPKERMNRTKQQQLQQTNDYQLENSKQGPAPRPRRAAKPGPRRVERVAAEPASIALPFDRVMLDENRSRGQAGQRSAVRLPRFPAGRPPFFHYRTLQFLTRSVVADITRLPARFHGCAAERSRRRRGPAPALAGVGSFRTRCRRPRAGPPRARGTRRRSRSTTSLCRKGVAARPWPEPGFSYAKGKGSARRG
jgi:hypothetical protein